MEATSDPTFAQRAEALLAPHSARAEGTGQDGIANFIVPAAQLRAALTVLRDHPELKFEMLYDVCSVDHLGREPRYEVIYHLRSLTHNHWLRVKTHTSSEEASVPSVCSVWPGADWHEREVFDMMGIRFTDHPDLRRILMPDDFEHHPLRKDYPVQGIEPWHSYLRAGGVLTGANMEPDRVAGDDATPSYIRPETKP
jgi:NADH-quinone oxidoreductase subunit C